MKIVIDNGNSCDPCPYLELGFDKNCGYRTYRCTRYSAHLLENRNKGDVPKRIEQCLIELGQ